MQVYRVDCKGLDEASYFRNFGDIEPSLRISYSACTSVDIVKAPTVGPIKITVTGFRDGETFRDVYTITRFSVWDSPTHL